MSDSQNGEIRDCSCFDRMSTEMLEDILKRDFEWKDGASSDTETILYIMRVIAKRKKEASIDGYSDAEQAWRSFQENYLPYVGEGFSLYADEDDTNSSCDTVLLQEPVKRKKRVFRRWAGIAAAVLIVVFGSSIATQAWGHPLWDTIAQWTSETFGFVSDRDTASAETDEPALQENGQYGSLQEALAADGITEPLVPTWIPQGYQLDAVEVVPVEPNTCYTAIYGSDEEHLVISIRHVVDGSKSTFEKDGDSVEIYEENGIRHYIFGNLEAVGAVWFHGANECCIEGTVSRDEIKEMIQSIYQR
ncbi:MAG: DUF4367 domain-containing protein [Butyricicoccaceae bacterium]